MWSLSLLLICFAQSFFIETSTQANDDDSRTLIEEFVREAMDYHDVPGLSLAVVQDGEIFLTNGYGITDFDNVQNITDETLFYIASTGKAMTSAMISQVFFESAEFGLDTPVQSIVGDAFQVADGYRRSELTSRDLLSHRVGIPTSEYQHFFSAIETRAELLQRARFFDALEPLRTQLTYNNVWYTWAGEVAASLMGIPYEELMRMYLFEPLGMDNSVFFHEMTEEDLEYMATPHFKELTSDELRKVNWEAFGGAELVAPSGGIVSNAQDLAKWLLFQTSGGLDPEENIVINQTAWEETIRKATMANDYLGEPDNIKPFNPVSVTQDYYGLGWFLGYYRGYRLMAHAGGYWGYWTLHTLLPDMSIGIFTLTNGPNGTQAGTCQNKIHQYIADILLGEEPWLNATTPNSDVSHLVNPDDIFSGALVEKQRKKLERESEVAAIDELMSNYEEYEFTGNDRESNRSKYVGTYGAWCCGNVTISHDPSTDVLSGQYGQTGNFILLPVNEANGVFVSVWGEPFWFIPPVADVRFYSSDGGETIDTVIVPLMLPQDPPVFVRERTMDDAPPPVDDCDFYNHI